jgi:hypothetical protein
MVQWGTQGDVPVCGDYDGDGVTDFAVRRAVGPQMAMYYLLLSSDQQMRTYSFGFPSDYTVPGDYDGDGKNDLAVFRQSDGTFFYVASSDGQIYIHPLGMIFEDGDRVVPGDYFGDARSDFVVWKYRTGNFHVFADGGSGPYTMFHFGLQGDEPVGFSNVH